MVKSRCTAKLAGLGWDSSFAISLLHGLEQVNLYLFYFGFTIYKMGIILVLTPIGSLGVANEPLHGKYAAQCLPCSKVSVQYMATTSNDIVLKKKQGRKWNIS